MKRKDIGAREGDGNSLSTCIKMSQWSLSSCTILRGGHPVSGIKFTILAHDHPEFP